MKGQLLRLASLEANAESAMRLVGFFDALVEHRADLRTVVRSAARLAECPVGASAPARGVCVRTGADGLSARPCSSRVR